MTNLRSPTWWRDTTPSDMPAYGALQLQGRVYALDLDGVPVDPHSGLSGLFFHKASVSGVTVPLDWMNLTVTWSEFDSCTFTQKGGRVLNEHGFSAQGSLGTRPSIYRNCVFQGVRFKGLGGFNMRAARFENCTFIRCKFNGHRAYETDLVNCKFIGKIDGCIWYGTAPEPGHQHDAGRRNEIINNDFSEATLTDNIGWRGNFDIDSQIWPAGAKPSLLEQ